MIRIVVDTNLLIAGRWKPESASNRVLDMCLEGVVQAVYSPKTKDENLFILGKVKAPKDYVDKVIRFYNASVHMTPKEKINVIKENQSDNRFLEVAVEGNADYVISSDHHLLDVKEYKGVKIIKPSEFIRIIEKMIP
ncbi:MAG: putative toxin-antitoxin system toxin component, PIN family [Candidatus Altiarchaeota archaeon]